MAFCVGHKACRYVTLTPGSIVFHSIKREVNSGLHLGVSSKSLHSLGLGTLTGADVGMKKEQTDRQTEELGWRVPGSLEKPQDPGSSVCLLYAGERWGPRHAAEWGNRPTWK